LTGTHWRKNFKRSFVDEGEQAARSEGVTGCARRALPDQKGGTMETKVVTIRKKVNPKLVEAFNKAVLAQSKGFETEWELEMELLPGSDHQDKIMNAILDAASKDETKLNFTALTEALIKELAVKKRVVQRHGPRASRSKLQAVKENPVGRINSD
jgi:hypothetical protein